MIVGKIVCFIIFQQTVFQVKSVEDARAPRRQKCGILVFVSNLEAFVSTTEAIFRGSERRSDLEKWYQMLVAQMVATIGEPMTRTEPHS